MTEHEAMLIYVLGLNVTRALAVCLLACMLLEILPWKKNK